MNVSLATVNGDAVAPQPSQGNTAPLKNITLLLTLTERSLRRKPHLPGMVCASGPSGFGKSFAAAWVSAQLRAYYVEARSVWSKRSMPQAILRQMGIQPARTIPEMIDQIGEQLALSGRPLIIDEFDHVIDRKLVELVRDIYEQSKATIVLIGEEQLPQKLKRVERFDGRILEFAQALPCDLDDARQLARLYCPRVTVEDDLLGRVVKLAHGSTRRVCVNLDRIADAARSEGLKSIGLAEWGDRPLHTGEAPRVRSF